MIGMMDINHLNMKMNINKITNYIIYDKKWALIHQ